MLSPVCLVPWALMVSSPPPASLPTLDICVQPWHLDPVLNDPSSGFQASIEVYEKHMPFGVESYLDSSPVLALISYESLMVRHSTYSEP